MSNVSYKPGTKIRLYNDDGDDYLELLAPDQYAVFARGGANTLGVTNTPIVIWKTDARTSGDGMLMSWEANNNALTPVSYAQIKVQIVDPAAGDESSKMIFLICAGDGMIPVLTLREDGVAVVNIIQVDNFICVYQTGRNGDGIPGDVAVAVWKTDAKTIGDGSIMSWQFNNSVDEAVSYAQIRTKIVNPAEGAEDGEIAIHTVRAGAMSPAMIINQNGYVTTSLQRWGNGDPEGVVVAPVGAFYSRLDGGVGSSFYVKESGSGNTGWAAK